MTARPGGNILLDTLTPRALSALELSHEDHPITTPLMRADESPTHVFFPAPGAVVSIVRSTENGSMVESALVGYEGMVVVQAILTDPQPGNHAVVQIEGRLSRAHHQKVREVFRANEPFRDATLAFASVFLDQVTQNLVCNRLHVIEQRLAKWLLAVRDRIDTDELHLTHDFLAHMLGVHRPGVSIAVAALEMDGLIRHRRNRLEIRDRAGLHKRTCECYRVLHTRLARFRADLA